MKTSILVVDDESAIREMVCLALAQEDYECLEAADGHKAEQRLRERRPDLILLDWMMPGMSGLDLVQRLRRQAETRDIPVIFLTARAEEEDMIRGLKSGADDYITKPFSTAELLARIEAVLRRRQGATVAEVMSYNGLNMDVAAHRVTCRGEPVEIGPTEFKLLKFFMENPNQVFSREQVLNHVWGLNVYVEERTVDVHIRRLRKALAPVGAEGLIQTVRGSGYRFS